MSRQLRILHLEASPGWGGQEIRILRESEGMRARGHTVILAPAKGGGLAEYGRKSGFKVYELEYRKRRALFCLWEIFRIIKEEKIDLVNTHSSLDSWIGGIAARLHKTPLVRTRHLSTAVRKGLNSRLLYHLLTDFVVTTCSSIIPSLSQQSGKPLAFFRAIPTGVDPAAISSSLEEALQFRETLGLGEKDILIGMVCFMRSWKGIHDFLQAADLLRRDPGLKWVIIGGGHSAEYKKRAAELRLEGIVHFTGHLEKPYAAMNALDIFSLLSTDHEGVSQASLQAAYLRKPLIMTSTGGLSEVCIHQKTGLQVPIFSPASVAEAVLKLRDNPLLREEMGERAKILVEEKYTLKAMLDAMETVFLQTVS